MKIQIQGLENASAGQLAAIEITPPGFGLHWPKLDADLYIPAVLEGILGTLRRMAAWLGAAADDRAAKPRPRRAGRMVSSAAGPPSELNQRSRWPLGPRFAW